VAPHKLFNPPDSFVARGLPICGMQALAIFRSPLVASLFLCLCPPSRRGDVILSFYFCSGLPPPFPPSPQSLNEGMKDTFRGSPPPP